MTNIENYLKECVYYPCSGLHGMPIKFLSRYFQRFFYVDYHRSRKEFDDSIREGFRGYQLCEVEKLTPEIVFGISWHTMRERHTGTFEKINFEWTEPFVVLCRFERMSDYDDDHGPETFELIYARCEAIAAYIEAFSRRNIAPKCLVHIRSGIGFGGNYSEYPQHLDSAVRENKGGMPAFMFFDSMGSDKKCGDYSHLVEDYKDLVEITGYPDGGRLTLAKLSRDYPT